MTPQQFEQKLKDSIPEIAKVMNNAPFVAVKEVESAITYRIFNTGKSADGTSIGKYDDTKKQTFLTNKSTFTKKQKKALTGEALTYKELREAKGLQTDYVDLQFSGDLKANIISGKENERAIVKINNSEEQKIAGFLTNKYNKPIFQPSEKERQEAKDLMVQYVQDEIRKIVASWR